MCCHLQIEQCYTAKSVCNAVFRFFQSSEEAELVSLDLLDILNSCKIVFISLLYSACVYVSRCVPWYLCMHE